jgi:hypothetical protein
MSVVTEWRNPQGRDENWLERAQDFTSMPSRFKRLAAGAAIGGIFILSQIELVASAVLYLVALPLKAVRIHAFNFTAVWIKGCFTTVLWSFTHFLFNFNVPNLITSESNASRFLQISHSEAPRLNPYHSRYTQDFKVAQLFPGMDREKVELATRLTNKAFKWWNSPDLGMARKWAQGFLQVMNGEFEGEYRRAYILNCYLEDFKKWKVDHEDAKAFYRYAGAELEIQLNHRQEEVWLYRNLA